MFFIVYVYAFMYLRYSDKPANSDVVVLFAGPVLQERLREARQLMIEEDYAKILIIPAHHLIISAHHEVFTLSNGKIKENRHFQKTPIDRKSYPRYYEDTHIEALEARKLMDMAGYSSAIFVSSPYQMRRISIISAKIFSNKDYQLKFIGSRYTQQDSYLSIFSGSNIKQVIIEYFKIIGFFLYQFYGVVVSNGPSILNTACFGYRW